MEEKYGRSYMSLERKDRDKEKHGLLIYWKHEQKKSLINCSGSNIQKSAKDGLKNPTLVCSCVYIL